MWIITLETALHQEEKVKRSIPRGTKENFRCHPTNHGHILATFSHFISHFRGNFLPTLVLLLLLIKHNLL
jgi:hypothetical protein